MKVIESTCVGRSMGSVCEDILVTEYRGGELVFAAVIDGVTDKSGLSFEGKTGGRVAAEVVAETIAELEADVDPYQAVKTITKALRVKRDELGVSAMSTTPPSASACVLSVERREVWRVGDCHIGVVAGGRLMPYPGDKAVDVAAALARSAYTACLLAGGHDPDDVAESDPGRRFIMPLLEAQGILANSLDMSPFAYGVLDGTDVPSRLVEVLPLPQEECEVVLATDGFIAPAMSLVEAEEALRHSVRQDPLRIGPYRGTKAMRPGANSFDDRTYVRISAGQSRSAPGEAHLRKRISW